MSNFFVTSFTLSIFQYFEFGHWMYFEISVKIVQRSSQQKLPFIVLFLKKMCQSVLGDLAQPPWSGPPLWLLPWRGWNQNKSCLNWLTDHFDIFFDRLRPHAGGHGGWPPPWLSPWWSWNQNKSCLDWWTDRLDVFFDHVWPPPSGLGVLPPSTELV